MLWSIRCYAPGSSHSAHEAGVCSSTHVYTCVRACGCADHRTVCSCKLGCMKQVCSFELSVGARAGVPLHACASERRVRSQPLLHALFSSKNNTCNTRRETHYFTQVVISMATAQLTACLLLAFVAGKVSAWLCLVVLGRVGTRCVGLGCVWLCETTLGDRGVTRKVQLHACDPASCAHACMPWHPPHTHTC